MEMFFDWTVWSHLMHWHMLGNLINILYEFWLCLGYVLVIQILHNLTNTHMFATKTLLFLDFNLQRLSFGVHTVESQRLNCISHGWKCIRGFTSSIPLYFVLFFIFLALQEDRYAFLAEWFDPTAALMRRYQLFFYPKDGSMEMVKKKSSYFSLQINFL